MLGGMRTATLFIGCVAAGCAWPLDLPPLPPVVTEQDGVRVRAHARATPIRSLTTEQNEARRRAELSAAATDAAWAVRVVHAESPTMPATVRDLVRGRWSDRGFPIGLYHPSLLSGDTIWVRELNRVHILAHEFGHVLQTHLLRASFYDDIPHLPDRFAGGAWDAAESRGPAGVWVTQYSRKNAREWFCEVYGAFIGFAAQLAGPLAAHAEELDLASLSAVAAHFVALGILRPDTAEFCSRVLADDRLRAQIERVTRIAHQARTPRDPLTWRAPGDDVAIGASSWREVSGARCSAIPWDQLLTFSADRARAIDTWISTAALRSVSDAADTLHQLLAFAGLSPEHLAAGIRSMHDAGDSEGAQALAARAARLAARSWREARTAPSEETARQLRWLRAALDRVLAEPPASLSFDLSNLERDLHYLVRAFCAREDLPAEALTADPRPELASLLEVLAPPASFYLYTGLRAPGQREPGR